MEVDGQHAGGGQKGEANASPSDVTAALVPGKGELWQDAELTLLQVCAPKGAGWTQIAGPYGSAKLPKGALSTINGAAQTAALLWDKAGKAQPIGVGIRSRPLPDPPREDAVPTLAVLNTGAASVYAFNQKASWETASIAWDGEASSSLELQIGSPGSAEGVSLDGLHHATDALPGFVHAIGPAARQSPFHAFGDSSVYVPARHVNGKMETPVLYFYSAHPQRVQVNVDFENGLLTEWYPDAASVAPAPEQLAGGALDLAGIERSSLAWDLEITPFSQGAPAGVPDVEDDDPWQFAREVRAGFVRPVLPGGARSAEAEHYVFYRGLGRLQLPIALRYCRGELKAQNQGDQPVSAAFALEMGEGRGRFEALGRFDAAEQKVVTFSAPAAPKERVVQALESQVQKALVAEGLYEDEARAMVRTWAPTWFAAEGTRVLYVLPRPTTDAMLPIRITPTPRELVRVLVGRQDILTPQVEAEVDQALAERASPNPAQWDAALRKLAKLGRFLEPAVRRAVLWTSDEVVKKSGAEVLAQFQ